MTEKFCEFCKLRKVNYKNGIYSSRCIPCTFKREKERSNEYNKKHAKKAPKVIKRCKKCFNLFEGTERRVYCQNPCQYKRIINHHEEWIKKDQEKDEFYRKKYRVGTAYRVDFY